MTDYNLTRGEELYFKEIDKLCLKHLPIQTEIKLLASCFSGKVGVMQEGLVSFKEFKNETELLFTLEGIPAYKKLALSVMDSLINCNTSEMKNQILYVIQSYNSGSYKKYEEAKTPVFEIDDKSYIDSNNEIENNLRQTQNLIDQIMFDEDENGNLITKEIQVDSIDLLDEFDEDDMTQEGWRSSGMIDVNFDTLENQTVKKTTNTNKILHGAIEILPDNSLEIICPYTGSKNVYQIDSSTYASFETDQPFKVRMNLADLKPDHI